MARTPSSIIDRTYTCPFLIHVYWSLNSQLRFSDFNPKPPTNNELLIYTWLNATLREITQIITSCDSVIKNTRSCHKIAFSIVQYNNVKGKFDIKRIGIVRIKNTTDDDAGKQTLEDLGFRIGDYLSIGFL